MPGQEEALQWLYCCHHAVMQVVVVVVVAALDMRRVAVVQAFDCHQKLA